MAIACFGLLRRMDTFEEEIKDAKTDKEVVKIEHPHVTKHRKKDLGLHYQIG